MTRTIKFRLWVPADEEEPGQMISGDDLAFEEYAPLTDLLSQDGIMQWTGFRDIAGKEIYEGDRIRLENDTGGRSYAFVEWGDADGAWNLAPYNETLGDFFCGYRIQVLGNRFANPELMGDDEDGKVS